jgi:nucleoside-diphosphate-sugar epimerase
MKVVMIGGNGFIGRHVGKQLVDSGNEVINFHRGQTPSQLLDCLEIFGERNDLESFRSEFEKLRPDVVIDMIAMSENDAQMLLRTFKGLVHRFVVISSADVYRNYELLRGVEEDEPHPGRITENSPLRRQLFPYRQKAKDESDPFYDYEKILVERTFLNNSEGTAIVLRLPAIYGPGDRQHRLFPYIKRMDDLRPAILVDSGMMEWRWTRGYVENVAAAISWAAGDQISTSRIYNVGEKNGLREKDWITQIGEAIGWQGRVVAVDPPKLPEWMRSGLRWQHRLETDTSLIRAQPGFSEPVSFQEGILRTIQWERGNPPEVKPEDFDYPSEDKVLKLVDGG